MMCDSAIDIALEHIGKWAGESIEAAELLERWVSGENSEELTSLSLDLIGRVKIYFNE